VLTSPEEFVNTQSFAAGFLEALSVRQAQLGLSDRALAKRLGISSAYLCYIRRGQRRITSSLARRVTGAFPDFQLFLPGTLNFSDPFYAYTCIEGMSRKSNCGLTVQVEGFLVAKQVEGKSPATLAFYRQNLSRFLWWVWENGISEDVCRIAAHHLRQFLAYVQPTPGRWGIGSASSQHLPSMATVDAYWRSLQALFSWLVREGVLRVEANPMRKLPRPKTPRKITQDIPLNLVREALDEWGSSSLVGSRNRAIILMFLDTGIRLSECANLTVSDLDLERGLVRVWGKGQKQRLVRVGEITKQALIRYFAIRGSNSTEALWLSATGRPITKVGVQTMVRRLKRLGGNVRWSPHTFRNTFAINYLRAGGDPFTLQILGGWEDLEMPRHYCAALKAEDAFKIHEKASPADKLALDSNSQEMTEGRAKDLHEGPKPLSHLEMVTNRPHFRANELEDTRDGTYN
jgi:site-specific recombinase XerC